MRKHRDFDAALSSAHIRTIHAVKSLDDQFPDYFLADVVGPKGTTGLALFLAENGQYVFGGMTLVGAGEQRLLTPSQAARIAGLNASHVTKADLAWGWSEDTSSPFSPLYQITTPSGLRYVDMSGGLSETVALQ